MKASAPPQRVVDPELLNQLDPVEKLIAQKFIDDGKWALKDTKLDQEN